jgi:hypothetical protein
MTDAGMHAVGASNDAMQHLIDCPDHDACDPAARIADRMVTIYRWVKSPPLPALTPSAGKTVTPITEAEVDVEI